MDFTRRQAISTLLLGAGLCAGATVNPTMAVAASRVVGSVDVTKSPLRIPSLFRSDAFVAGRPTEFFPHAAMLKTVASSHYGQQLVSQFGELGEAVQSVKGQAPLAQLAAVNAAINRVPYIRDNKQFGTNERWVMPAQFLARGGDCEDFALAKMSTLRAMGYHTDRLRLVLVEDLQLREYHAILAVILGGEAMILDNNRRNVSPASTIRHYQPMCSMTADRMWIHIRQSQNRRRSNKRFAEFAMREKMRSLGQSQFAAR